MTIGLQVSDDGFDGGAAAKLALDDTEDAALLDLLGALGDPVAAVMAVDMLEGLVARIAVVVEPVDQGADRGVFLILDDRGVIECPQQRSAALKFLQQALAINIEAESFRRRVEIGPIDEVRDLVGRGSYLTFDANGHVHKDLVASGFAALETGMALEEALRQPQTKIVDLTPKLNREKWERENRWTPSKEDLDAIADDIWRRKRAGQPTIERAKGAAPRPPKITWEAEDALKEISKNLMTIEQQAQMA